jgi:diguanylate cyclase (GGDEF)-like protein
MKVPATTGSAGRDVPTADVSASVRGVLALYDRIGGGEFDEGDLRTVRTFAGHAAVAVDNVRLHDEARRLSHTDPLTGLYNYRHLQEMLEREISRSARFEHPLCVMALDLDLFKDVNDTYGHGAGDAVLVEFARRLGAVIRGVDLAFRAGGEEFVLLLPETGAPGGVVLAQRLGAVIRDSKMTVPDTLRATADLNTMELPLVRLATQAASPGSPASARATSARDGSTGQPRHIADVPITVSIGVAVFPEHGTTGGQLLEAADRALYAAKSGGRDTYRVAVHRPPPNPVASSGEDAAASAGDGPDDAAEPVAVAVTSGEGRDDGHRDRPAAVSPPGTAGRGIRPRRGSDDGASPVGGGDRPDGESTTGPPARQPPGR